MTEMKELVPSVSVINEGALCELAAKKFDLEIGGKSGTSIYFSKPFAEINLTPELLAELATHGIVRVPRRTDDIFELHVEELGDYWNFKKQESGEYDLRILLSVQMKASKNGVALWPQADGTFVSPARPKTHCYMIQALAKCSLELPLIVGEFLRSDPGGLRLEISWKDLGLDGLRSVQDLFYEFVADRHNVLLLAQVIGLFTLSPCSAHRIFCEKSAQSGLFSIWETELRNFKNSL